MATISKSFTSADIFQGQADVYLGVKAPASANPPVEGTNTLVLDSSGQPTIAATGQIATISLGATGSGGTGYTLGDVLTITQSGGSFGQAKVLTLGGGGAVATLLLLRNGNGYATANNLPTTGGSGSAATINILTITSGFHLGLTEGPASINLAPKFDLIKADQFSAPVDAAFISNTGEIDIVVKELVLANIQKYLAGLMSATYYNLSAGSTNPAADFLQVGSTPSSSALVTTLLLVGPRRDVPNKFLYVMAYRCYMKSAIQLSVQRSKETMIKLKFSMLADVTRVATDMACQIVRTL